jgi:alpha-beta hydrolase superfamily lysophospholipase
VPTSTPRPQAKNKASSLDENLKELDRVMFETKISDKKFMHLAMLKLQSYDDRITQKTFEHALLP